MSRRSSKLNFASLDRSPPRLDLLTVDWAKIEVAYGHSIPEAARAEIIEITNKFLEFSAFAHTALSLTEALKRVDALKRCASDLLATVCNRSDPSVWAVDGIIDKHLRTLSANEWKGLPQRVPGAGLGGVDDLAIVADVASYLKAACAKTKQELEERASSGLSEDAHWMHWVRRVIEIAEKHGLPHGVRKDRRKNRSSDPHALWKPSPVVRLIKTLQNYMPAQYRKTARDDALSQAINLARAEYRLLTKSGN
jgi:hypothetical protein